MGWLSGARQAAYARRDLGVLAERLSCAGLSVSGSGAGLLAHVDQHAAAVRDILATSGGPVGVVELAAYAQGALDAAADAGWTPECHQAVLSRSHSDTDAETARWIALRLLAVCVLAEGSRLGGDVPDIDPLLFT